MLHNSNEYTAVEIKLKTGKQKLFIISNSNNDKDTEHKLKINNKVYSWKGAYILTENK